MALPAEDRKSILSQTRIGVLRKIVSLSQSAEEVEGLEGVLRGWRVLGGRITEQTGNEIVGELIILA